MQMPKCRHCWKNHCFLCDNPGAKSCTTCLVTHLWKPNTCRDDRQDAAIRWESGESGMWGQAGSGTGKVFSPSGRRAGNSQPSLQHRCPRLIPRAATHLQETQDTISKHCLWKPKSSKRSLTCMVWSFSGPSATGANTKFNFTTLSWGK